MHQALFYSMQQCTMWNANRTTSANLVIGIYNLNKSLFMLVMAGKKKSNTGCQTIKCGSY